MPRPKSMSAFAPLAFGAALAVHGAAEAHTPDLDKLRLTGLDAGPAASADAARDQGRQLLKSDKVAEALQAFRQSLLQDPDSIETLNGIAVAYDRLGRYEEARVHYEMALGIAPSSPMLLNNYGLSLYLRGEMAQAARFLALAAASGDPDVQAASLRILARIDTASRQAAIASPQPQQSAPVARIVRTSGHEQRLVLGVPRQAGVAATQVAATLADPDAVAVAAIGALAPQDDARIASNEARSVALEQFALAAEAARQQALQMALAQPDLPESMQAVLASLAAAAPARAGAPRGPTLPTTPARTQSDTPAPPGPDWYADQLLVAAAVQMSASPVPQSRGSAGRIDMALLAAGLGPQRQAARRVTSDQTEPSAEPETQGRHRRRWPGADQTEPSAEPETRKRQFRDPFESDNSRLNGFAARFQTAAANDGPDTATRVARLEALLAQLQAA